MKKRHKKEHTSRGYNVTYDFIHPKGEGQIVGENRVSLSLHALMVKIQLPDLG